MAANDTPALGVSDAIALAKTTVGSIPTLQVVGEVTGFRGPNARSGHCYFQVKDDESAMDVIVWRNAYAQSGVELRDGLEVVLSGKFDIYQKTARLSFVARKLEVSGEGLLRQQVAQLARKLEAEGLMDPARKRPIPRFCTRVAVVTSLSGSVIDDVKRTLRRRNPLVELLVAGCAVQGPGAPASIMRALEVAAAAQPDCILLVRGGGSFEDLMTFNDEALARAVAACPVPVVTGIGHEPDTCICDMVADRRCSVPAAAAESVAPALDEIVASIDERQARLVRRFETDVAGRRAALDGFAVRARAAALARVRRERTAVEALARHRCLQDPTTMVDDRMNDLMLTEQRLHDAIPRALARNGRDLRTLASRLDAAAQRLVDPHAARVEAQAATLSALSPLRVLERGYAIVRDVEGHVVSSSSQVEEGQDVRVLLGAGTLGARVTERLLPGEDGR